MSIFKPHTTLAISALGLAALTGFTGCSSAHHGGTDTRWSEPSGGGTAVAAERPGAGVGAQTSAGAAADVPEATQKGAGASDLTKGGSREAGGGQLQGQGAAVTSGTTITQPSTLTSASDPSSLTGRPVNLSNLKVQRVLNQHLVEVSDDSGKPLYVRVNQPVQDLKPDDLVSLSGTVNRVPADPTNLGFNPEASQALQGQSIYLDAQQLQVTSH